MNLASKMKWLFGKNSDLYPANMPLGMWFWAARRITGVVVALYLFAHLYVLSTFWSGQSAWSGMMEVMTSDLFVFLDFLLLGAVIAHAVTGVAVICFDFGVGIRKHKLVYWVLAAVGIVLLIGAAYGAWYLITH
jgi:succinate dehydrogenase / fumarate reductase cytochrome b subunit